MKSEIDQFKKERLEQRAYIESLENKIVDTQHRSLPSGVEIRNIPVIENESPSSLPKAFCNISEQVGLPLTEMQICDEYHFPGKPTSKITPRPIIIELNSVHININMFIAVRSYNRNKKDNQEKLNTKHLPGNIQPVYVTEQLPLSMKKLFHSARVYAKK